MIEIRPVERGDEPAWRSLWRGYLDYYETELAEAVYRSSFARIVAPDVRDYSGFLALQDGRPAGLVHYIYHRHGWQIEDVCYLQDLFVLPEMRGSGIGRALIEAVYEAADKNGTPSVYWLTQDFNTPARKLYDTLASVTPFIKYRR